MLQDGLGFAPGKPGWPVAALTDSAVYELALDDGDKAFARSVIQRITSRAHAGDQTRRFESAPERQAGKLGAHIAVMGQTRITPAARNCHRLRVNNPFRLHAVTHGPAHDLATERIHDGGQKQPANPRPGSARWLCTQTRDVQGHRVRRRKSYAILDRIRSSQRTNCTTDQAKGIYPR